MTPYKAIPPVEPIQITFATAQEAIAHQTDHGGWIFVADQCSNGFWFSPAHFTATSVMLHPVLHGESGRVL